MAVGGDEGQQRRRGEGATGGAARTGDPGAGRATKAVVLPDGEGRVIRLGPTRVVVKEDGSATRGTLAVAEAFMPPGGPGPRPHYHRAHEEGFYVLEGEAEFVVGGETRRVGPGGWALVPIGVVHHFRQVGDAPARMLWTFTPRTYLDYFDEAAGIAAAFFAATPNPTPKQLKELGARVEQELMPKYDTFLVG